MFQRLPAASVLNGAEPLDNSDKYEFLHSWIVFFTTKTRLFSLDRTAMECGTLSAEAVFTCRYCERTHFTFLPDMVNWTFRASTWEYLRGNGTLPKWGSAWQETALRRRTVRSQPCLLTRTRPDYVITTGLCSTWPRLSSVTLQTLNNGTDSRIATRSKHSRSLAGTVQCSSLFGAVQEFVGISNAIRRSLPSVYSTIQCITNDYHSPRHGYFSQNERDFPSMSIHQTARHGETGNKATPVSFSNASVGPSL